jgi:glycosyltransferase involved in cell wall biosynthesis
MVPAGILPIPDILQELVIIQKTGVLFVSSAELPGADTFIHTLIMRNLDRSRFDVHVAYSAEHPGARTPAFEVLETIPNLHLKPFNFGPSLSDRSGIAKTAGVWGSLSTLVGFAGLARYVRKHNIRVIHSTDRPRDAVSCAVLGKLSGAKSVIHAHLRFAEWMGRGLRWSMAQVDAIAAVSEFVAQSLVDNGYARTKTHALLNAIELADWDFRMDGGPIRREFGIPANAPVISCVARLFRGKGQDDVIRAMAAIRDEFPDVRVLVIGRDDRQAMRTSFTEELKVLAQEIGVTDNVIFTGHRTDMPALMAACDVFALPSMLEPFGLVFVEAMAMKKPVLALDSGGVPEIVEHGKSGLLSALSDARGLAANMRTLLRDPQLRAQMGEYGRRRVERSFTSERLAEDTAALYAKLIASPTGHTAGVLGHVSL